MSARFSVIIPTRERADTLYYSMQTVLAQTFPDFELVISDNFSSDNTHQVVHSFNDPRIKYVKTARRVSMSDNWDFALEHATGDFVIFIGDDDALMPQALRSIDQLAEEKSYPAFFWPKHIYIWPMNNQPARLTIAETAQDKRIDLRRVVRQALRWGGRKGELLPCGYHAAVSRRVFLAMRERSGRAFHTMAPDCFSMYSVPVFAEEALLVGDALSVAGASARSNSGAHVQRDFKNWETFLAECGDYKTHRKVYPKVPMLVALLTDAPLVAMDIFPEYYADVSFNFEAMWALMLRSILADGRNGMALNWDNVRMAKKFDTVWGIIRKRREISVYHHINVAKLLFYRLAFLVADLREAVLSLGKPAMLSEGGTIPEDIFAAVRLIGERRQVRAKPQQSPGAR